MPFHAESWPGSGRRRVRDDGVFLAALWVIATAINLTKAFHIDDTAHLEIAQWIAAHPWRPMSGLLNWDDSAEPIFVTNQPHLYFYAMALVGALFGFAELPMHLLLAAFTLWAIVAMHALALRFAPDRAALLTFCVAISPGVLVNQNTMVDVPLLALLLTATLLATAARPVGAFAILSLAVLTKYSSLFAYPALLWAGGVRRGWRTVAAAWLPLLAILAWSAFNIADYGAAHIAQRPGLGSGLWERAARWLDLAESFGVFTLPVGVLVLARTGGARRIALAGAGLAFAALAGQAAAGTAAVTPWLPVNLLLTASVGVVGMAALLRCIQVFGAALAAPLPWRALIEAERGSGVGTLALWLGGGCLFILLFAPFSASRHALLMVPPLFLLACQGLPAPRAARPGGWAMAGLAVYAGAALFVALADRAFAGFYRDAAPLAAARAREAAAPGAQVFYRGHWGWQWYARRTGMMEFDRARTVIAPGDILVDPVDTAVQRLPPELRFETVAVIREATGPFTAIDTLPLYAVPLGGSGAATIRPNRGREIRILRRVE